MDSVFANGMHRTLVTAERCGYKASPDLAAASKLADALRATPLDTVGVTDETPTTVEEALDLVERAAASAVLKTARQQARSELLDRLAGRVAHHVRQDAEAILAAMGKAYDVWAGEFATLASVIPRNPTDAALVRSGAAAVEAWARAQEIAQEFDEIRRARTWLGDATNRSRGNRLDQTCRYLDPGSVHVEEAASALHQKGTDAGNVWLSAVHLGCTLRWASDDDARSLATQLSVGV